MRGGVRERVRGWERESETHIEREGEREREGKFRENAVYVRKWNSNQVLT